MGSLKIKTNYSLYILLIIAFASCSDNHSNSWEANEDYHLTLKTNNPEEGNSFIEASKEFELKHNEIFQKDLNSKSKEYYDNVIESFIDKETGILELFGEMWDLVFKSENERKLLWKLKIERYFSTTSFLTYIRNEILVYTDGLNHQRKNGISKILGVKHSSNLKLSMVVNQYSFSSKNETVENIVRKINEEIIDQLADIPLDSLFTVIIVTFIGFFGTISVALRKIIGFIIIIFCFVFFYIRTDIRQNEIKEILKKEVYDTLEATNINYLDQLNNNTNGYYLQLQKLKYDN